MGVSLMAVTTLVGFPDRPIHDWLAELSACIVPGVLTWPGRGLDDADMDALIAALHSSQVRTDPRVCCLSRQSNSR